MNNRILAVVVTHNRFPLLVRCLNALRHQTCSDFDILVVDNASTDDTPQWLSSQNDLTTLRLNENTGGAGGFSAGVREAVQRGYQRIWLMDDDTFCQPDTLQQLKEADHLLQGQFGFLSSAVLWKDGRECKMNRQKIKKSFYTEVHQLREGLILIDQATFVSLYLNAQAVIDWGLPIRQYFIWGDDIEYTLRLSSHTPCYLCGKSQVVHWMDNNCGSSIALDQPQRLNRYRYAFRNENCTYRRRGLKGFAYYLAKCGLNLYRILRFAPDHRLLRSSILLGGMIRGLFFNPPIEQVRPPVSKEEPYESA